MCEVGVVEVYGMAGQVVGGERDGVERHAAVNEIVVRPTEQS